MGTNDASSECLTDSWLNLVASCLKVLRASPHDVADCCAAPVLYLREFLSETEVASFFDWAHTEQVMKVEQYLDFLGQQPDTAHFTASSKASVSFAKLNETAVTSITIDTDGLVDGTSGPKASALVQQLLEGRTRSGFGAFGTEVGFLPQKRLSLAVANVVKEIGHTYVMEHNKRGNVVLNSRSFFFYWCHAEKQKLMDVREKLVARDISIQMRCLFWQQLVIVVDRAMCDDCIQFATCFARFEKSFICIQDPAVTRSFPPSSTQQVRVSDT
uniref:Single-strand DNA deaminase toxin A-like C-terminal domain-containing protein n=1 Tax=Peronospora matthiolae TaxID=2874970 RepID=A0AAV1VLR6_9STRA